MVNQHMEYDQSLPPPTEQTILETLQRQNQILEELRTLVLNSLERQNEKEYAFRSRVIDLNMSISSMVGFSLKWMIAAIPVAIVVSLVAFVISVLFGGLFAALL